MKRLVSLCTVLALLAFAPTASACSVCFGNPESLLTQGAQQGVIVMLIVTYAVILGLAAMFAAVIIRARRRAAAETSELTPHTVS